MVAAAPRPAVSAAGLGQAREGSACSPAPPRPAMARRRVVARAAEVDAVEEQKQELSQMLNRCGGTGLQVPATLRPSGRDAGLHHFGLPS